MNFLSSALVFFFCMIAHAADQDCLKSLENDFYLTKALLNDGEIAKIYKSSKNAHPTCGNFKSVRRFISLDEKDCFARISGEIRIKNELSCNIVNARELEVLKKIKSEYGNHKSFTGLPLIYSIEENKNEFVVDQKWYELVDKTSIPDDKKKNFIAGITLGIQNLLKIDVVHDDLNYTNFMFDNDYNGIVIDFGLTSPLSYNPDDKIRGNPDYYSPAKHEFKHNRSKEQKERDLVFELSLALLEIFDENEFKKFKEDYKFCIVEEFRTEECKKSMYLYNNLFNDKKSGKKTSNIAKFLKVNLVYDPIMRMSFNEFFNCVQELKETDFVSNAKEGELAQSPCFEFKKEKPIVNKTGLRKASAMPKIDK